MVKVQTGPGPPGGAVCSWGPAGGQGPASGPGAPLGESVQVGGQAGRRGDPHRPGGGGVCGVRPSPALMLGCLGGFPARRPGGLPVALLWPLSVAGLGKPSLGAPADFPGREAGVSSPLLPAASGGSLKPCRQRPALPPGPGSVSARRPVRSCCPRTPPPIPPHGPSGLRELHLLQEAL